jgi:hypothetical protein
MPSVTDRSVTGAIANSPDIVMATTDQPFKVGLWGIPITAGAIMGSRRVDRRSNPNEAASYMGHIPYLSSQPPEKAGRTGYDGETEFGEAVDNNESSRMAKNWATSAAIVCSSPVREAT